MEQITMFISNVGFPIVACVYMMKRDEQFIECINQLILSNKELVFKVENLEDEVREFKNA